jgi:hypothetical protein
MQSTGFMKDKDKTTEQEAWVKLVHESACCSHSPHEEEAKEKYVRNILDDKKVPKKHTER